MQKILGIFIFVCSLTSFAQSTYHCQSSDQKKSVEVSIVGNSITVLSWGDKELLNSLETYFTFDSLQTPWTVRNEQGNCANNLCSDFMFDANTKYLTVSLWENDEMTSFYDQEYLCQKVK
jgi:hypothetical protein